MKNLTLKQVKKCHCQDCGYVTREIPNRPWPDFDGFIYDCKCGSSFLILNKNVESCEICQKIKPGDFWEGKFTCEDCYSKIVK